MTQNLDQLAVQARSDLNARNQLLRHTYQHILLPASYKLKSQLMDPDDIAQQSLIRINHYLDRYDPDKGAWRKFAMWQHRCELHTLARRPAVTQTTAPLEYEPAVNDNPDARVRLWDIRQYYRNDQRKTKLLDMLAAGYTAREISEATGLAVKSVYNDIADLRAELRQLVRRGII